MKTPMEVYTNYEESIAYLHHWGLNFVPAWASMASFVGRRSCGLSVTVVENGARLQLLLLTSFVFVSLLSGDRLFAPDENRQTYSESTLRYAD
jgi:hypothetical protein